MKKKKYCDGCRDNMYNYGGVTGNTSQCMRLSSSKIVKRKEVSVYQTPPYYQKAYKTLDCYHRDGYAYLEE